MQQQQKIPSTRKLIVQQSHNRNLDHALKSLQDQIQLTIYNYENILQTQKKNSAQRSQFLLYLIQSLRTRHNEQLQALNLQIQTSQNQRESAQQMQKQMQNIGEGLDQIMQQSHKLKQQNQQLIKQLDQQKFRQKQLDQEIQAYQDQLEQCRLKVDDWERIKIKWNRHKKQLMEMIEDAEKTVAESPFMNDSSENVDQKSMCMESGQLKTSCDHCQKNRIQELYIKYNKAPRQSH